MWWFGNYSSIWRLKSGICAHWAFKSLDLFGCKLCARGCVLIQGARRFTECWARGSAGWNVSGCDWMFAGKGEICTRTSKLVSKVNFVISVKLEWKIVCFLPVANSCFSEWNIVYYKTLFFHKLLLLAAGYQNNQSSISFSPVKT